MNIRDLRPWEYDEMEADDYDEISHLQSRYAEETRLATEAAERLEARRRGR